MIALKVFVNGQHACTAGAEDLAVLNAIVGASGTLGPKTRVYREGSDPLLTLRVGGLTDRVSEADEHLDWIEPLNLAIGDEVTIQILETESPEVPLSSREKDEERATEKRRDEWEYAKEYYNTYREEFEASDEESS